MPQSLAARVTSRSATMPRRWPSIAGMRRLRAQRRLPSMMIATCFGSRVGSSVTPRGGRKSVATGVRELESTVSIRCARTPRNRRSARTRRRRARRAGAPEVPAARRRPPQGTAGPKPGIATADRRAPRERPSTEPSSTLRSSARSLRVSNLHDFFFFADDELVDLLDELVGDLLDLLLTALDLVVGDRVILRLERLHLVDRLVTEVADRDLVLFGFLFDQLHEVFAALFVELRN